MLRWSFPAKCFVYDLWYVYWFAATWQPMVSHKLCMLHWFVGVTSCSVLCTLPLLPFFLALLDYVSRAREIKMCPSFVRLSSVRVAIISEANARMSFTFWFLFQLGHTLGHVLNFWKTNDFLRLFVVFVNKETYGSKNFKTLCLLQIAAESFQTVPEFSSQWSSQNYVWDFWNFENWEFNECFSFSLTWDPMGVKISKRYPFYFASPSLYLEKRWAKMAEILDLRGRY